jgi:ADP-heptose:LPS heptosyltransferase
MTLKTRLLIDYHIGGLAHLVLKPLVIFLGWLLRRDHHLETTTDVVVVKLLGGGSLIIAYPALLAIKRQPNIKSLRLVASPTTKPFAELLGIFDEIIVIREAGLMAVIADSLKALARLWRCDTMVDLEIHSRLSTIFCLLTAARNRVGFYTQGSFWRRGISTHLLFCQVNEGIYHFYDQVAQLLGAVVPPWEECSRTLRSFLQIDDRLSPRVNAEPLESSKVALRIAIAPCCSDLCKERMLRPHEWATVLAAHFPSADSVKEIHLLGAPSDHDRLEAVRLAIEPLWPATRVLNRAASLSLGQSVHLITQMDQLLAVDSSMLHSARLLGVPTVSYWGPTDPLTSLRPSDAPRDEVHYAKLPCSPCVHISSQTPCRGNNLCIRFAVNPAFPANRNPPWLASHPDPQPRFHPLTVSAGR